MKWTIDVHQLSSLVYFSYSILYDFQQATTIVDTMMYAFLKRIMGKVQCKSAAI